MKRYFICILLSLVFITVVFTSQKSDCKASMAFPTAAPQPVSDLPGNTIQSAWLDESGFITSGNYVYRIIDETKKEIEIRGINSSESKLVIPETIDGYKVVSLGYCGTVIPDEIVYASLQIKGTCKDTLQELIIPEGVREIGTGAFSDFIKLRSVLFPESMIYIQARAFINCSSLDNINLPSGTMVQMMAFRGCASLKNITINCSYLGEEIFEGEIDKIHIVAGGNRQVGLGSSIFSSTVNRIIVDEDVKLVSFKYVDYFNNVVKSLIINGKKTNVETGDDGYNMWGSIKFGVLYTVPDAKCISWAKKEKVSYKIKTVEKVKNVTCTKKKNTYIYSWDKAKTTVETHKYKKAAKKWKVTNKNIQTKYNVYGKNKKNGKYKLITRTAKNSVKTKYKYIKIYPDYNWT